MFWREYRCAVRLMLSIPGCPYLLPSLSARVYSSIYLRPLPSSCDHILCAAVAAVCTIFRSIVHPLPRLPGILHRALSAIFVSSFGKVPWTCASSSVSALGGIPCCQWAPTCSLARIVREIRGRRPNWPRSPYHEGRRCYTYRARGQESMA